LAGISTLELATDRPRPPVWTGEGDVVRFTLPSDVVAEVDRVGRAHRATRFMVLLAAFQAMLARYTGQPDPVVGTPVAGRAQVDLEPMIGFFVNSVVLRADLSDDPSFATLLRRVRADALDAFSHAEVPFELVVDAVAPERDLSRNPLFQVSFAMRGATAVTFDLPGLDVEQVETPLVGSPFDLSLDLKPGPDGELVARLQYATALFERSTAQRFADGYRRLLDAVLADPNAPVTECDLLTPEERRVLLAGPADDAAPLPERCLHELFADQVERTPEAVAVRDAAGDLTFRELDDRANRFAHRLRAHGVGPESLVGVCLPRGAELIVALLAVLKAGGAYVPLAPDHPPARRARLLTAADARILIATGEDATCASGWTGTVLDVAEATAPGPVGPPTQLAVPDNAAYLIYTSGSTGEPKGVTITHRNLVNYVTWAAEAYRGAGAGAPLYSSVAFDMPVTALFPPLLSGAPVTIVPDEGATGVEALAEILGRRNFDLVKLTPTHLGMLGGALSPEAVRATGHLVVGGEQLTDDLLTPWRRHAPDTLVINEYGPTEATVGCCVLTRRVADLEPGVVPIGAPIANTRMYVLDAELRPVPIGAVGELYIGGAGLARGYHNRGDLTADRFVPDPFAAQPGQRLYRTGDLARYRSDLTLEYLGRTDAQVKINGFRIELGEIEAALTAHPDIRQAAVVACEVAGQRRLAAYLVPATEAVPQPAQLRSELGRVLPGHMIPAYFVALAEIPTTASGKVDRRALPDPVANRLTADEGAPVEPRSATEEVVAGVWTELLGVARIGVHDDFFALGGNSLTATRVVFRLRELLAVDLPLAEVFTARTVARLAAAVDAAKGRQEAPILPVPRDTPLPLSFAQQRLWFLDRLTPGATDYLVPVALRLSGRLDAVALRSALDTLAQRHEVLRTRYAPGDDGPVQIVDPTARIPFQQVDLTTVDEPRRTEEGLALLRADARRPFDLATQIPVRATLVRLGEDEHLFLLTLHHIAFDGWSADLLADELSRYYAAWAAGRAPEGEAAPVQYADYAVWQRAQADGPALAGQLAYWRTQLANLVPQELPTDRRRPRIRDARGDQFSLDVPAEVGRAVNALAQRHGATPFMVLLAAFTQLLSRYTGGSDLAVGTPVAGRSRPETARLLGFFANTVVLRVDLAGARSFEELLERVREVALAAYRHADVPFERIVEELAPDRDLSRNPLFQVMFETRPTGSAGYDLPGLHAEAVPVARPTAKFDLMLSARQRPDGSLHLWFEYATALFDEATVRRLADHYRRLLTAAVTDPHRPLDRIGMLSPAEHDRLVAGWHDTTVPAPDECLPEMFLTQAARTPHAVAVAFKDRTLSYAELAARVERLTRRLRDLGVRAETPVAVALRRDEDLVTAMLAVLRAGGVYVPIDPDHPRRRREYVLRDSGARVLVSQGWIRQEPPEADLRLVLLDAPDEETDGALDGEAGQLPALDPAGAAYIVYTSGSTGLPKGVVVSHEAIRNRVLWTVREHGLGPGDRVLQKTTVAFDAAMWEFLAPLVCGGTVVVAGDEVPRDPAAMVRELIEQRVTVLQLVPSVLRTLVEQPELAGCEALRLVFCAGEPLPADLCRRLIDLVPVTLYNTYGPTECAIDVTSWRYTGAEPGEIVAIGHPVSNTRILVLDAADRLVPVGVPGELCVAGVGLARGYAGRPDLTAERFVPNPYPRVPGERLYRTGDLVRRRPDGRLEYLGRLDGQVKIRGVRIEPGEIEAALAEHPQVAVAAVVVHRVDADDYRLVAHFVPADATVPSVAELRAHLADRVPEAMIPSIFRPIDALPLTANGKVDRAALPEPENLRQAIDGEYVAPRTPTERALAELFADVLGIDQVGVDDDFFALGGHSLLATRLVFRARTVLGAELPVAEVFTRRTVARLAELVAALPAAGDGDPVVPVPRTGPLALSSAQSRMWFLDQLEPGSAEYLVPVVLRLDGALDAVQLAGALDDVVARHESLRTRYLAPDGSPVQVIDAPGPMGLTPVDLRGPDRATVDARAGELIDRETTRPFYLDREAPLRALLVRVDDDEYLLALTAHHIAVDAWSIEVLLRDLAACYRARVSGTPAPPPPAVQYADFAVWQGRWANGPQPQEHLDYWRERLRGLSPVELPTDRPRPVTRDPHGELLAVEMPADCAAEVELLARRHGVTPFVVLLAVFDVLLARYTRQTDIAVGTPVAGRTRAEIEHVVGAFINTVVLRADLAGDPTFATLLDRVHDDVVGAYSHQALPFERLVDELAPQRDMSRNPLFQIMFDFQHGGPTDLGLDGVRVTKLATPWQTAKFDLTLTVARRADGGLRCVFEYATALFDRDTIARMAGHYLRLVGEAVRSPEKRLSHLEMVTDDERRQLLRDWASADPAELDAVPGAQSALTVPELFRLRAASQPDAEAVVFGDRRLTYAELDERADRLAHHLRAAGVRPETVVAVCLQRGLDVVVALLAVLRAGGVYVPLDPEHPTDRLAFMLDDAGASVIVTEDRYVDRLPDTTAAVVSLDGDAARIAAWPAEAPSWRVDPDHLAYMIFTSGSTGRPKGVLIEHASYAHHCAVIARSYDIRPTDRVVLLSALTFDVAMDQIAATLLVGATVLVADPLFWSPAELPERVAEHGITIMEITPAYYREVLNHVQPADPRLRGLRLMNVGSDVVTFDDARRWQETGLPGRFLCNYGPTEATVTCLLHPVPFVPAGARAEAALPIGRPVPGTRTYILDPHGRPVPAGVPGELHLGGIRLARGYHRRPELTAEKFVPDPFGEVPGQRLYRTGDLVRYLPDGTIEFLGRIDQQVKLRGFRIELGEIEAVLAGHPEVRAVAVVARETTPGDRRLVAYLVPVGAELPDVAQLREYAGQRLPEYMVPSIWCKLSELPLTSSKKVDRKALPDPPAQRPDLERPYLAPRTPTEEVLVGIWADVLGVDRIGVNDDFFALGGHSLLATRVLAQLNEAFGVTLPLRRLFAATTVAQLADVLEEAIEAELAQLSDDEIAKLLAQEGEK
jgi:amino acid adenylation domain-containing protein